MEKNKIKRSTNKQIDVRQLTICALLCAMNVVLGRLLPLINTQVIRLSIEAVPVILAGYFFGAVPGMIVGFVGDTIGCLFSSFGWDPILCLSPMLIGFFAGLLRPLVRNARKMRDVWRVFLTIVPGMVIGSMLWTSQCLIWLGYSAKSLPVLMGSKAVEILIELVVDSLVIMLLMATGVFARARLIPYKKQPLDTIRVVSMAFLAVQIVLIIVCSLTTGMRFTDKSRTILERIETGLAFFIPTILSAYGYLLSLIKGKENNNDHQ